MAITREILDHMSEAYNAYLKKRSLWEEQSKKPDIVQDPNIVLNDDERLTYETLKEPLEAVVAEVAENLGIDNFQLLPVFRDRLIDEKGC